MHEVRRRQGILLWVEGALYGFVAAALVGVMAGWVGASQVGFARALLGVGVVAAVACVTFFGWLRRRERVGDEQKTARWIGRRVPGLSLDLLGAFELDGAKTGDGPFSSQLAAAFVDDVDGRVRSVVAGTVVDSKPVRRAAIVAAAALVLSAVSLSTVPRIRSGLSRAFATAPKDVVLPVRDPITGDIEVSYRYPAYTGLAPRTVAGTNGELSAPAGTEVRLKTRADRDVQRAQAVVNGQGVPLQLEGTRDLRGRFTLDKPGSYKFAFVTPKGKAVEGPDTPIHIEVDAPPDVRLSAPTESEEIDPGQEVLLKYEAGDDFGLTELALVYRLPRDANERRISLSRDEGRHTSGQHTWRLDPKEVRAGDTISYFVEAKDNDAVAGPKRGVSRTQTLKIYSAAEHRQLAVQRATELWERLITHLADRLDGPDRARDKNIEKVAAHNRIDRLGLELVADLAATARELSRERDAPTELWTALANISQGLGTKVRATQDFRRFYLRYARNDSAMGMGARLTRAAEEEIAELEKDILYLESLIDRQKLLDLKELAKELNESRRDLASLIEDFKKTQDPATRERIFAEVQALKNKIAQLHQRMAELAKGIRDEHLNAEALQAMMDEENLGSALDEVERLLAEGKTDEAMKKLQELGMQLDEMLSGLDEAEDDFGAEQFPGLAEKFQEFAEELAKTEAAQKRVAGDTKSIRDRLKAEQRKRMQKLGDAMKEELLRKTDDVLKDYRAISQDPAGQLGHNAEKPLEDVLSELENLKNSLKVDDYDLAAESSDRSERSAQELAHLGEQQRRLDEVYQNPPDAKQRSQRLAERLRKDSRTVQEISKQLKELFPDPASLMSSPDQQKLKELSSEQRQLEKQAQSLRQRMEEMSQMAPIFDENALEQMNQVGEHMGGAAQKLDKKDSARGYAEQKEALDQLQSLSQEMRQSKGRGRGRGLPLPMFAGNDQSGFGHDPATKKVELPDPDKFQAPKEFRKDLLEAMKQGVPERYRPQVKRYYEELVK